MQQENLSYTPYKDIQIEDSTETTVVERFARQIAYELCEEIPAGTDIEAYGNDAARRYHDVIGEFGYLSLDDCEIELERFSEADIVEHVEGLSDFNLGGEIAQDAKETAKSREERGLV